MTSHSNDIPTLADLLVRHRAALQEFLRREASGLLRYESVEDLAQGVHVRALQETGSFEYRSEKQFFAWLFAVARHHIADRHDYWSALKRGAGRVLRYTLGGSSAEQNSAVLLPAGVEPGPQTFATRRELVAQTARALAALPPRDRDLVRWQSEGIDVDERAARLGLSYAAAQRASLRAVERFKKTFRLLGQ